MRSPITTKVIDTVTGKPVTSVHVTLEIEQGAGHWKNIGGGRTNDDGRHGALLPAGSKLERGLYRLTFEVASYFRRMNVNGFYPYVTITFEVREPEGQYDVPLYLSPFGYSTFRG